MTEGNDCLLTEATQYLLKTQNKDGSWPATFHNPNAGTEAPKKKKSKRETEDGGLHPYDELHPVSTYSPVAHTWTSFGCTKACGLLSAMVCFRLG